MTTLMSLFWRQFALKTPFSNILDIDECKDIPQICDLNAVCNNTKGSYQCTCKTGSTGNGHNCTGNYFFCLSGPKRATT